MVHLKRLRSSYIGCRKKYQNSSVDCGEKFWNSSAVNGENEKFVDQSGRKPCQFRKSLVRKHCKNYQCVLEKISIFDNQSHIKNVKFDSGSSEKNSEIFQSAAENNAKFVDRSRKKSQKSSVNRGDNPKSLKKSIHWSWNSSANRRKIAKFFNLVFKNIVKFIKRSREKIAKFISPSWKKIIELFSRFQIKMVNSLFSYGKLPGFSSISPPKTRKICQSVKEKYREIR